MIIPSIILIVAYLIWKDHDRRAKVDKEKTERESAAWAALRGESLATIQGNREAIKARDGLGRMTSPIKRREA